MINNYRKKYKKAHIQKRYSQCTQHDGDGMSGMKARAQRDNDFDICLEVTSPLLAGALPLFRPWKQKNSKAFFIEPLMTAFYARIKICRFSGHGFLITVHKHLSL